MKTYIFRTAMEQEDDGRWSVWIQALPGCTAWGHTKEEALGAIKDAAEAYVADMLDAGDQLPTEGVEIFEEPVVAVTMPCGARSQRAVSRLFSTHVSRRESIAAART